MKAGTGGDPPTLYCLTHSYKVIRREKPFFYDQQAKSGWFIEIDISEAPLNHPFVIMYNVIYKNGFQGSPQFTAAWSDKSWENISISVQFPKSKKFIPPCNLYEYKIEKNAEILPYLGVPDTLSNKTNTFFKWNFPNPKLNYTYRVEWNWE